MDSVECELASSMNSESNQSTDDDDDTTDTRYKVTTTPRTLKRECDGKNIVNPDVASALDRTQISDREAVYVLSATASSLRHNVNELVINRSNIRRTRISTRKHVAAIIKESFTSKVPLTVHWDGKMLPDLAGKGKADGLSVLVSGAGVRKLL